MKKSTTMNKAKRLGVFSFVMLFVCVILACCAFSLVTNPIVEENQPALAMAGSGDGSESNPYIMTTVDDWKTVIDRASSATNYTYVELGADIVGNGEFSITGLTAGEGKAILVGALNVPSGKYVHLDLKTYKINR